MKGLIVGVTYVQSYPYEQPQLAYKHAKDAILGVKK